MLHANLLALLFLSPELWATEVNFVGIGIFDHFWSCDLDLNPMTFMYKLDPYTWENEKRKVFRSQRKLSKEQSDLEDSLVMSSGPLGQPQKRPGERTSDAVVVVRTSVIAWQPIARRSVWHAVPFEINCCEFSRRM